MPNHADCVIQVEDTKVVRRIGASEEVVNILAEPTAGLDIRPIGCDLQKGELVFGSKHYPGNVVAKSVLASTGHRLVWVICRQVHERFGTKVYILRILQQLA